MLATRRKRNGLVTPSSFIKRERSSRGSVRPALALSNGNGTRPVRHSHGPRGWCGRLGGRGCVLVRRVLASRVGGGLSQWLGLTETVTRPGPRGALRSSPFLLRGEKFLAKAYTVTRYNETSLHASLQVQKRTQLQRDALCLGYANRTSIGRSRAIIRQKNASPLGHAAANGVPTDRTAHILASPPPCCSQMTAAVRLR